MSVQAMSWALTQQELSPQAKLILIALANYADANGDHCHPGQDRLAEDTCLSVRSIQRYTAELRKRGMVGTTHRARDYGTGGRTSNQYTLIGYPANLAGNPEGYPAKSGRGKPPLLAAINNKEGTVSYNRQKEIVRVSKKRRCQISEDFTPSDALKTKLLAAWQRADIHRECQRFIDYHRAKGSVFLDHDRAFQNWMGRAKEFQNGRDNADDYEVV